METKSRYFLWKTCLFGCLWLLTSSVLAAPAGSPRISIIIDNLGYQKQAGLEVARLPGPVGCSILPHTEFSVLLAKECHAQGKPVILNTPMEPVGHLKLGKGGLYAGMTQEKFLATLNDDLQAVPYIEGMDNHMGSLLTTSTQEMTWLMQAIQPHDLFFLDNRTARHSVIERVADANNVPVAGRDIFLDDVRTPDAIHRQFAEMLRIAKRYGSVVAVAHPNPVTIHFLQEALPGLQQQGYELVPVNALLKGNTDRNNVVAGNPPATHKLHAEVNRNSVKPAKLVKQSVSPAALPHDTVQQKQAAVIVISQNGQHLSAQKVTAADKQAPAATTVAAPLTTVTPKVAAPEKVQIPATQANAAEKSDMHTVVKQTAVANKNNTKPDKAKALIVVQSEQNIPVTNNNAAPVEHANKPVTAEESPSRLHKLFLSIKTLLPRESVSKEKVVSAKEDTSSAPPVTIVPTSAPLMFQTVKPPVIVFDSDDAKATKQKDMPVAVPTTTANVPATSNNKPAVSAAKPVVAATAEIAKTVDTKKKTGFLAHIHNKFCEIYPHGCITKSNTTVTPPPVAAVEQPFTALQGKLPWPTQGNIAIHFGALEDRSGLRYTGVLIKAPLGQSVHAIYPGRVVFANRLQGFGLLMIIDHGNGYMSLYGHNQKLYKKVGDIVQANEAIAAVGDTGRHVPAGLYFEIRHDSEPVNPQEWCATSIKDFKTTIG